VTETLELSFRPPLAWDALIGFLGARAVPGVEELRDGVYRRTVPGEQDSAVVEARLAGPAAIQLDVEGAASGRFERLAREAFDLDADPTAVAECLGRDPILARVLGSVPGLRVPGTFDPFELAVRAVLGQQVSVQGARTLSGRLVERFGTELPEPSGGLTHVFPRPEALADAPVETIGMPRARGETIRLIAQAMVGGLDLSPAAPWAETRARLLAIRGIGPWTADYVAMRVLRDPDAFPAADLGLRHALAANGRRLSPAEVERCSAPWRPWRAYAVMYLWETLSS
jgi:AraC family transcriptional regulator of adaptative response / DNA-3-methyladenine glycosylase II